MIVMDVMPGTVVNRTGELRRNLSGTEVKIIGACGYGFSRENHSACEHVHDDHLPMPTTQGIISVLKL
jgi:hypothetical protein